MNLTRKNTSFPIYVGPLDYFTRACFLKSTTSRNRLIMPLRPSDCIMHLITSSFLSFCVVSLICRSRVAWWQVSDAVTMVTYLVRGCRGFKRTHFLLTLSFQFLDLVLTFLYIYWIDFLIRYRWALNSRILLLVSIRGTKSAIEHTQSFWVWK